MCDACPSPEKEEEKREEGGVMDGPSVEKPVLQLREEERERPMGREGDGSGLRCPDKEGQALVVVPHGIGEGEGN